MGAALLLCASFSSAQTTNITPGGLGTALNGSTAVGCTSGTCDITGGTPKGSNLFHSFGAFSVGPGDVANFNNVEGRAISNILGRVTGGEVSSIFGTIQTTDFGAANLFLINPAGWIFGSGAALNVGGSFHVSTADYIRLGDGVQFNADGTGDLLLTSAPPAAFGFLGPAVAPISVDGSFLAVPEGQTLSLVGGDVSVAGSTLYAPSGSVQIASVASAGEVTIPNLDVSSFSSLGQVTISADGFGTPSVLDTTGIPIFDPNFFNITGGGDGGQVVIRGGQLVLSDSIVQTGGYGDVNGAKIDVAVSGDAALTFSFIDASGRQTFDVDGFTPTGGGAGGAVIVRSGSLTLNGSTLLAATYGDANGATLGIDFAVTNDVTLAGSALVAFTQGAGDGGGVRISAGSLLMQEFSGITSGSASGGRGGDIGIEAGSVTFTDSSGIVSSAFGSGAGGDISVAATSADSFVMSGGASIVSQTIGDGVGGKVSLTSPSMTLDSGSLATSQSFGTGAGGDLVVQAGDLTLMGGAQLQSQTGGAQGGSILVTATGSAMISGADSGIFSAGAGLNGEPAGNISLAARQLTVTGGGAIQNGSFADRAGSISVTATDSIVISNGGKIVSQAFDLPVGDVTVSAPTGSLVMDAGLIQTSTINQGDAGNVIVDVGTLSLVNGAQIVTSSVGGVGQGGDLTINASGPVLISGMSAGDPVSILTGNDASSGLFSKASTDPAGGGGQITVTGSVLTISDGGKISASAPGAGTAGSIALNATTISVTGAAQVTAATFGDGPGGNVNLNANQVNIQSGGRVTADSGGLIDGVVFIGTGAGGSVSISATDAIVVSDAGTVSTTTFGNGKGGNVEFSAGNSVSIANGGAVRADSGGMLGGSVVSGTGDAGNITISSGNQISLDNGQITTQALTADGGNITLLAPNIVQLQDSIISTSVAGGLGQGGNIFIDPQFVLVNNSLIIANAFGGPGGNITIIADNFLQSATSIISASSALSTPGVIEIRSPDNNVESSIQQLPAAFQDAGALLRGLCTARRTGAASSFVVAGRGGVPVDADGYLPSFGTDVAAAMAGAGEPAQVAAGATARPTLAVALLLANDLDCAR